MNESANDPPACYSKGQGQSKTEMPKPFHQHPSHLVLLPKGTKGSRMAQRTSRREGALADANTLQHWRVGRREKWYKHLGLMARRGEGRGTTGLRFSFSSSGTGHLRGASAKSGRDLI